MVVSIAPNMSANNRVDDIRNIFSLVSSLNVVVPGKYLDTTMSIIFDSTV